MARILAEIRPTDRVLDIGVANDDSLDALKRGVWLHGFLRQKAASVLGVDILEAEVRLLQEMGYAVVLADAETMRLDEEFDVIVAGEIIEHLSNPGAFLDRSYEHLANDGRLIISTPYPWSLIYIAGAVLNRPSVNPQHTCWFDPVTLTQLLRRHRFLVTALDLVRLPARARGRRVSHWLCRLGLKRLGACGYVVVCRPLGKGPSQETTGSIAEQSDSAVP